MLAKEANQLKTIAASPEATFRSMRNKKFSEEARVHGATIAFWQKWIELTASTARRFSEKRTPALVVVGTWDLQFAPDDKERIRALVQAGDELIEVEHADHHLLLRDVLHASTSEQVLTALRALLTPESS